ncbi:LafD [Vibrio metschnikovii]|uniref:LafD n=1 Tax=Vibrio metschnikovii TaxID=28172 RepID=UPI002FCAFD4D
MENKHKILASYLVQLAQRIEKARQDSDWEALNVYDQKIKMLMMEHKEIINAPELSDELKQLKSVYMAAFSTLKTATEKLKQDIHLLDVQQERAMAYELTMPMEIMR